MSQQRVIATRPCAWCQTGIVRITTKTRIRHRATRRFCSQLCANKAGGITHAPDWSQRLCEASKIARQKKALDDAEALMGDLPPAAAARAIYRRAYSAGWVAGKKTGVSSEYRRLMRLAIARRGAA